MFRKFIFLQIQFFVGIVSLGVCAHEEPAPETPEIVAVTTANPGVPLDDLALMLVPLTVEELKVETQAWMELLRLKTQQTSEAELAIKQKNKSIEKAVEVQEVIEETQEVLAEVSEASQEAQISGSLESTEKAQELAGEARQAVEAAVDTIETAIETQVTVAADSNVEKALSAAAQSNSELLGDQADIAMDASEEAASAADRAVAAAETGKKGSAIKHAREAVEATREANKALETSSDVIEQGIVDPEVIADIPKEAGLQTTAMLAEQIAERELEDKKEILLSVNELRNERTALSDRLNLVLDELSSKLGKTPEGLEHEFILPFRLYSNSVNTIKVDVSDTQSAVSNMVGWMRSDLGGIRLLKNIAYFVASILAFWALGWILGKLVDRGLKMTRITAELMRSVIVRTVRRGFVFLGIIVGLSAMGINIGPILAVIGAAGFVIAFALQDTLSNFASGIMIMIYRPFDVGDLITVGGVTGEARSMNLVSTTIATRDNQLLVVPNNTVWRNIITNITGSATRRVDMIFRIRYEDDIELAQAMIREVLEQQALVLAEPEPIIAVQQLAPVSVEIVCRPWVRTEDYWNVYREVTREVKERFQAAGMLPPFLQENLRISQVVPGPEDPPATFPSN